MTLSVFSSLFSIQFFPLSRTLPTFLFGIIEIVNGSPFCLRYVISYFQQTKSYVQGLLGLIFESLLFSGNWLINFVEDSFLEMIFRKR